MTAPSADPVAALERLMTAVEGADLALVRDAYHPDAVIWHSNDGQEQSVDGNLATLTWISTNLGPLRYVNVRRYPFPGGAVEQHDTIVPLPGRADPLSIPACVVVLVDDAGLITRLDEYIDSAAVAALVSAVTSTRD